jgi:peptide deformylase
MSETQTSTDEEGRERQSRRQVEALQQIRVLGDPVLRETAPPVVEFDRDLAKLANKMIRIMHDAPGVGLAATQLGYMRRMLVYDVDDGPQALVNPEIVDASPETEVGEEGCLSIPGARMPVERALRVRVAAQDVRGRAIEIEAEELEARVIQHELDHLNGVLIVDRTTREARAEVLRRLRETVSAGEL